MKAGDKAWVFAAGTQTIVECEVMFTHEYAGETEVTVNWELPDGEVVSSGGFILGRNIFPTREELCKHYRKIFK